MNPNAEPVSPLRNNRSIWMVVASIMAAGLVTADAQLLSADDFLYAPGDLTGASANGPTPFFATDWNPNDAWGGTPGTILQVQGTGATYPGLDAGGGSLAVGSTTFNDGWAGANSVANRAGRQFSSPWTSATDATTYYVSFLMGFGTTGPGHIGYRAFEMWNGGVNDNPGRVLQLGYSSYDDFGFNSSTMFLEVNPNGPNTLTNPLGVNQLIPVNGTGAFGADGGATHLFVLRFDLSSTAGLDVIQLYVDPADLSNEFANVPNAVFVGDFVASHLSAGTQFILPALGGAPDVAPQPDNIGIFDRLRVSSDWGSIMVPEPTSFSLLAVGAGLFLAARRKKA
jgi:hypothetical protein